MFRFAQNKWHALPNNLRGGIWIILAGFAFVMMSAMIKLLAQTGMHALEISFFRTLFGFLAILPFIAVGGIKMVKTSNLNLQIQRAFLGLTTMILYTFALIFLPLIDIVAIGFSKPFFMTIIGIIFLAEKLDLPRGAATLVGFIGVVIILQPTGNFQWAGLLSIGAVISICLGNVIVKRMDDHVYTVAFYFGLIMTPITFALALPNWTTPTPEAWLYIIPLGIFATASQVFIMFGVRAGETGAVMSYDYLRIFFAAFIGYTIFNEVPYAVTWVGTAVILCSTIFIAHRETQLKRNTAAAQGD